MPNDTGAAMRERQMLRRMDELERQTAKLPNRIKGGGGGGSLRIRDVTALPAIPSSGADVVNWVGHGIWFTHSSASWWFPIHWTEDSGIPV